MGVANLAKLFPSLSLDSSEGNFVRDTWDRLRRLPGGRRAFSVVLGRAAPYTGTIGAFVQELGQGNSHVVLRDRPAVRNHLRCVHAIALANLAELAGNAALAYSLPNDARFIVAGMSIEYRKKARGTIHAYCTLTPIASSERREYEVPVRLENTEGVVVATATLRTLVGPKKR